ncbi:hypothetical protein [Kingella sp. (in: b-proteobacteria)]|uniref:hypothetical protein n=1 Tax=Kingella sp. (in: b-proteobacteria) TaxID=2020713 RepID=UPI0026DD2291|nr:hypothetical protein [Kingella sp. (in: b-proteobacteria)]MDO4657840.1 hypothetical protein [Kingella sp. (in: b-proteobacteria)]
MSFRRVFEHTIGSLKFTMERRRLVAKWRQQYLAETHCACFQAVFWRLHWIKQTQFAFQPTYAKTPHPCNKF